MEASQPSGVDSSRASFSAGNPFISDAGPTFDPEQVNDEPATPLRVLDVEWQPDRLKTILRAQGLLTHDLIGVGHEDWAWRDSELEAIAEPMANVWNKIPVLRAAAAVSDELTVGAVMFEYSARSIRERARVIKAHKARQAQAQQPAQRPSGAPPEAHTFDLGPTPPAPTPPPENMDWKVPE